MTVTVTATTQPDWAPPRVEVTVTATAPTVDNTPVSAVRVHSDGTRWNVLTPDNLRLSSMSALFYDNHPPRNLAFTYEVTVGAVVATSTATQWTATAPNIMPVDAGTGGEARMLEWVRSTGGLTISPAAATLAAGETITAKDIPATDGEDYTFGVNTTDDATVGLQFRSGSVELGLPDTAAGVGADRPFLTAESPASSTLLDISVTNDSGAPITVSQPTLLIGTAYPTEADPTLGGVGGSQLLAVDPDAVWLCHRIDPSLSLRCDAVVSFGAIGRQPSLGTFTIPNRRNSVHISGGSLHGGSGDLVVRCDSDEAFAAMGALLLDAGPILVATPGTVGWDVKWQWIQPTQVTKDNPGGLVSYPYRHVTITYDETDQPAVVGIGRITYGGVKALFTGFTYGDMKLIWATYRDAKTDTRIA